MLEKHIIEARAKALAYEEREMERQKQNMSSHADMSAMPPGLITRVIVINKKNSERKLNQEQK